MPLNFPSSPSLNDTVFYEPANSTYEWDGSRWVLLYGIRGVNFVTADYAMENEDDIVYVDTFSAGTATTITLPASVQTNKTVSVIDANNYFGANNVTVIGNGNQIEGANTFVLAQPATETTFVYHNGEWNVYIDNKYRYQDAALPQVSGPASAFEASTAIVNIANVNSAFTYTLTPSTGTATRSGGVITWVLPTVEVDTPATLDILVNTGTSTSTFTHTLTIINLIVEGDGAIVIVDFSTAPAADLTTLASGTEWDIT